MDFENLIRVSTELDNGGLPMPGVKYVYKFTVEGQELVFKKDTKKHRWLVFLNGEQVGDYTNLQGLAVLNVLRAIKSAAGTAHKMEKRD